MVMLENAVLEFCAGSRISIGISSCKIELHIQSVFDILFKFSSYYIREMLCWFDY